MPVLTNGNSKILLELDSNVTFTNLLKSCYFEKKSTHWKPIKFELVVNPKLTDEYQQIKKEFQANAKDPIEYEEKYGFIIENDSVVNEICQNGYSCPDNYYNVIGQSKAGVYLCKYPDVNLKFVESKRFPEYPLLKMIIFKLCYGKQTLALVRKDAKLPPIGATQNFSSHMSVIAPKEKDDIETQFDHSQIYLYEMEANKMPIKRPRHCLPYAVVSWLKFNDGTEWPLNFSELEISNLDSLIKENGETLQQTVTADASTPLNGHTNGQFVAKQEDQEMTDKKAENIEPTVEQASIVKNESLEITENPSAPPPENMTEAEKSNHEETTTTTSDVEKPKTETENPNEDNSKTENKETTSSSPPPPPPVVTENSEQSHVNGVTTETPTTTTTTPIANSTATVTPAAVSTLPVVIPQTSLSYPHHKTSLSHYQKSTYSYRQPVVGNSSQISPYLYAAAAAAQQQQQQLQQQLQQLQSQQQQHHHHAAAQHLRLPYGAQTLQSLQAASQQAAAYHQNPYQAAVQQQQQQQQQMFLVRTPNGSVQYVTAAPPQAATLQQQLQAQMQAQLQAQVSLQQQQQQVAALAAAQAQQVAALQHQQYNQKFTTPGVAEQQQKVTTSKIVYQAAPQPASASSTTSPSSSTTTTSSSASNTSASTTGQSNKPGDNNKPSTMPVPTQSPKSQQQQQAAQYQHYTAQALAQAQAVQQQQLLLSQQQQQNPLFATPTQINQINNMQQMAAAYSGQPTYFAYAQQQQQQQLQQQPHGATSPHQQHHHQQLQQQLQYLQQQQQLQLQQQQQQLQIQQQQHQQQQYASTQSGAAGVPPGVASLNLQNYLAQLQQQQQHPQPTLQPGQQQIPAGYQLMDNYRQLQQAGATPNPALAGVGGLPSAISLEQYAAAAGISIGGAPRPRIVNLRHHPYQQR
jgi:hypothetical protein